MQSFATRAILLGLATAVGFLQPGRAEFVRRSVLDKQSRGVRVLLAIGITAILHPLIGDESATFPTAKPVNDTAPEHLCPGAVIIVSEALTVRPGPISGPCRW